MLGVSKLCSPRPKAGDVLLSWARASAYEDRAVEYLKSADLAPDRTVQNRFIAIARHYRTLAQIERRVARETSPQTRLSQRPIDQNRSGSLILFRICFIDYYFRRDDHRAIGSCARSRLPRCTKFSCSQGKSLALPPQSNNSTKVLVRSFVRKTASAGDDANNFYWRCRAVNKRWADRSGRD